MLLLPGTVLDAGGHVRRAGAKTDRGAYIHVRRDLDSTHGQLRRGRVAASADPRLRRAGAGRGRRAVCRQGNGPQSSRPLRQREFNEHLRGRWIRPTPTRRMPPRRRAEPSGDGERALARAGEAAARAHLRGHRRHPPESPSAPLRRRPPGHRPQARRRVRPRPLRRSSSPATRTRSASSPATKIRRSAISSSTSNRYPELQARVRQRRNVCSFPTPRTTRCCASIKSQLDLRNVRSIVVVPIRWEGSVIGAIFLRTERDAEPFQRRDVRFCQTVRVAHREGLRYAHRFEPCSAASRTPRSGSAVASCSGSRRSRLTKERATWAERCCPAPTRLARLDAGESLEQAGSTSVRRARARPKLAIVRSPRSRQESIRTASSSSRNIHFAPPTRRRCASAPSRRASSRSTRISCRCCRSATPSTKKELAAWEERLVRIAGDDVRRSGLHL